MKSSCVLKLHRQWVWERLSYGNMALDIVLEETIKNDGLMPIMAVIKFYVSYPDHRSENFENYVGYSSQGVRMYW